MAAMAVMFLLVVKGVECNEISKHFSLNSLTWKKTFNNSHSSKFSSRNLSNILWWIRIKYTRFMQNNWHKPVKAIPRDSGLDFLICLSRCDKTAYSLKRKRETENRDWLCNSYLSNLNGLTCMNLHTKKTSKSRRAVLINTLIKQILVDGKTTNVYWTYWNWLSSD